MLQEPRVQLKDGLDCTKKAPTSVPTTREQSTTGFIPLQVGKAGVELKGDWEKARQLIETAIRTQRAHDVALQATNFALSAWILAQLGEASEALHHIREGEQRLDGLLAKGAHVYSPWDYHALGRACLLLGRLGDARRVANRAVDSCSSQLGFAAYALHLVGDIATDPDASDPKSGEAYYRQALALAEPRGMRLLIAHCYDTTVSESYTSAPASAEKRKRTSRLPHPCMAT